MRLTAATGVGRIDGPPAVSGRTGGSGALQEELAEQGATRLDNLQQVHFSVGGHLLCQADYPTERAYLMTRPFLEDAVCRRVRSLPRIVVRDGTEVTGLVVESSGPRVVGVRAVERAPEPFPEGMLPADLVVDTLGRAAHSQGWLAELGCERAPEESMPIDLAYVSQLLSLPKGPVPQSLVYLGPAPGKARGLALFRCEADIWMLTVFAYGVRRLPTTRAGMLELVADRIPADVLAALHGSVPLSDLATFRFPAGRRRRFDRVRGFPEGLLVAGDAMCSFNPIYGQGMSVAALQALTLRDCLARGDRDLPRRFFAAVAKPVNTAWTLAVGADAALPEVEAVRTRQTRVLGAYVDRVQAAAERDPATAWRFLQVTSLLLPASALLSPGVVWRALTNRKLPATSPAGPAEPQVGQPTGTA